MRVAIVLGQALGRASLHTLRRWLSESGIDPDGECVWLTMLSERNPKDSVIKAAAAEMLTALAGMPDLKAAVAVGRFAVRLDTDLWRGGILRSHGHSGALKLPTGNAPVNPDDPSTFRRLNAIAMQDPYTYTRYVQDSKSRQAVEFENACKLILSRVVHIDDPVLMPDVLERPRVYCNSLVGLDTETNEGPGADPSILKPYKELLRRISKTAKLDPRAQTLKMVALSDGQLSFSGVDYGPDAEPIIYNAPFDMVITKAWEPRWHDPKMLAHLNGEKDTEMKSLALRWLGRPLMHYDEAGGTDREPSYCVADSMTHRDLLTEGIKRSSPGILNLYESVERPMLRLYARWTQQGVFELDREPAAALYTQQIEEIDALTKRIAALTRGAVTNPDSTDQKAAYIFGWNKEANPDDKPSVDAKALSERLHVRGVPEIQERAKLKKTASTYLGAWLDWPFELLGCIWRGTGAWTGRPSVAALQLHNVPPELRKYLKQRAGKRLKSFDNSQLEIRVAAHISRDSQMIRLLRGQIPGYEDADIHRWATELISKALRRPVSRTFGKIGNFSQLYGGSEAAIYSQAPRFGATVEEVRPVARVIADAIHAAYPEFNAWANKVKHLPRVPGLFGAMLIPPPHPDESYLERERVNAPIQRGGIDITKIQTLALELAGFRTVHQIHDEVIVELDECDDTEETDREIKRIMQNAVSLDVPLRVDSKYWGGKAA